MLGGSAVSTFQENLHVELEPHGLRLPENVIKRDGRLIPFEAGKILIAVEKCLTQVASLVTAEAVCQQALRAVAARFGTVTPSVEDIQDCVVMAMFGVGEFEGARQYIDYRAHRADQRQEEVPEDVKAAFDLDATYFPTSSQRFMFYDKYSRYSEEKGRRETWPETVERVMSFLTDLSERRLAPDVYRRLHDGILKMEVMPSMRTLAMAGPAAVRNHISTYNCSYLPIRDIQSFVECLLISMHGCGVGYSVERDHIENFPRVKRQRAGIVPCHLIEDTTEGWGEAVRAGLTTWWSGRDITFDYSLVRPAGSVLKTKGGRASGPGPLREFLTFARALLLGRQGSYLRSVDVHDLVCKIGDAAVAGGVRRTAMIALFDADDLDMLNCKSGMALDNNPHRWNANNSAVWVRDTSDLEIIEQMAAMARGRRGEPGIFSRDAMNKTRPKRRKTAAFGVNPCGEIGLRPYQFCVSGDTPLITREGLMSIKEAEGRTVHIWNGERWSEVCPFKTGTNQRLYRVEFSDGSFLDCTGGHRFSVSTIQTRHRRYPGSKPAWREMTLDEIRETGVQKRWATPPFVIDQVEGEVPDIDTYTLGAAVGDGWVEKPNGKAKVCVGLYGVKDSVMPVVGVKGKPYIANASNPDLLMTRVACYDQDPLLVTRLKTSHEALDKLFLWSRDSILKFVAGWIDADGSETGTGGIRLYISQEARARKVQLLLTRCGIRSSVCLLHKAGSVTNYGARTQDLWYLQITNGSDIPCHRVDTSGGHPSRFKSKFQTIRAVTELSGLHDTFCFTEKERHMGVFANTLTYQCNLSIAVARKGDTEEDVKRKVEMATILGTIQSMATNFPGLRPEWKDNCEEERLLGVDITGQADCEILAHTTAEGAALRERLREHAIQVNAEYADLFGIQRSAAITCDKPSGNSSELLDCASGIHRRKYAYFVRNMRVSASSPLYRVLKDAGVPMDPENGQTAANATTWVVHFPKKAPEGALLQDGYSAVEQCEFWLLNKRHWTEHNPSCTITYRANELADLISWVVKHKDILGGLSFLPASDVQYDQMPYEEIDEATYEKLAAGFPEVDYSKLYVYERRDMTTSAKELACASGTCELV